MDSHMKIKPQHYNHMLEAMHPFTDKAIAHAEYLKTTTERVPKDPAVRLRWDWFYAAKLTQFACDTLYKEGLHNDHIDTALRSIVRELCPTLTPAD